MIDVSRQSACRARPFARPSAATRGRAGTRATREATMDLGIEGKTALVCAASKGLGRGCAEALAAEGV
ncbi:TPA: SDR family oxidoreductase, partial [Burkholderia cenocepacia]